MMKWLFFTLFLSIGAFASETDCISDFVDSSDECLAAKKWTPSSFTETGMLDKVETFRIVFHSISGMEWLAAYAPESGGWSEKLLLNPELIVNNPKVSASVITNLKNKTFFGKIGFILEVHPENVVTTKSDDSQSPLLKDYSWWEMRKLKKYSRGKGLEIKTPELPQV